MISSWASMLLVVAEEMNARVLFAGCFSSRASRILSLTYDPHLIPACYGTVGGANIPD